MIFSGPSNNHSNKSPIIRELHWRCKSYCVKRERNFHLPILDRETGFRSSLRRQSMLTKCTSWGGVVCRVKWKSLDFRDCETRTGGMGYTESLWCDWLDRLESTRGSCVVRPIPVQYVFSHCVVLFTASQWVVQFKTSVPRSFVLELQFNWWVLHKG